MPFRPSKLTPVSVDQSPVATAAQAGMAFDLSDFGPEQRTDLLYLMERHPIPHSWIDEHTISPLPGYEQELGTIVATARGGDLDERVPLVAGKSAPLSARFIAYGLDRIASVAVVALILFIVEKPWPVVLAVLLEVGNHVVGFGERGRSIGKLATSIVVRRRTGGQLSAGEALVRWFVRDMFVTVSWVGWWTFGPGGSLALPLLSGVASVALFATVIVDVHHRGIHDLIIDSAVYRSNTVGLSDEYLDHAQVVD